MLQVWTEACHQSFGGVELQNMCELYEEAYFSAVQHFSHYATKWSAESPWCSV